jgi:serine/threonine protein kinase
VSPQLRIKIGDLGLAKYTGVDAGTELHTVAGTRDYTAPEVNGMYARDEMEQDYYTSAVDIWSSGCIAHKILTDKPAFPNGLLGLLSGRVALSTSRLVERKVSLPAQKLLRRMLAAAPQNRPTAKECFDDAWIAAPTTAEERRRSPSTHVELPPPMDVVVVVVSSTERVTERLAAFQLATVQHTDHTEHTDYAGRIENWFVVRVVGEGTYGLVRLEQQSKTNELRAVKTVKIGPKSTRVWREIHALAELTKAQSSPPPPLPAVAIRKEKKRNFN